jgi:hypothetical protein
MKRVYLKKCRKIPTDWYGPAPGSGVSCGLDNRFPENGLFCNQVTDVMRVSRSELGALRDDKLKQAATDSL